ncbi:MAG TPA: hypothetical protein VF172_06450 [Nitrososphaera sp.]|jgi:hypothetical protein
MLGGIKIGLLSSAKNRKIIVMVGGALIAIGIAGMITIGSQASDILTTQGSFGDPEVADSFFYGEYAFLFVIVAGLVLTIFGVVSMQRDSAKQRSPSNR